METPFCTSRNGSPAWSPTVEVARFGRIFVGQARHLSVEKHLKANSPTEEIWKSAVKFASPVLFYILRSRRSDWISFRNF
jgi:hypothetical protein